MSGISGIATTVADGIKEFLNDYIPESVRDLIPGGFDDLIKNMDVPMEQITKASVKDLFDVSSEYLAASGYPFPFVVSPLLPLILLSLIKDKHSPNTKNNFDSVYDYIIVGAGSAGCVLASRLSERGCVTVLLLEAGKTPPILTEIPDVGVIFFLSDIDWKYPTVPLENTAFAQKNRQIYFNSGKTVGGSSILNAMFAVRGNRRDYDDWAAEGATGWSYEDVFPYFMKMENNTEEEFLENGFHAIGGPMTIEKPRFTSKIKQPLMDAAIHLGYRFLDSNADTQTGFFDFEATMRTGRRCSTAKAYLVPAENRKNLDIIANAMVRRIVIEDKKAVGVRFDFNGLTHEVKARKEVILTAGAIGTPQLLMLSGIGPKEELERFQIPLVADLQVGENMQDHIAAPMAFKLDKSKFVPDLLNIMNPLHIMDYIKHKRNKLASSYGGPLLAFLNNEGPQPSIDYPDFQLFFIEAPDIMLKKILNLKKSFYKEVLKPYMKDPNFICVAQVLRPKSRGYIRLNSTNPYDLPLINPRYYDNITDLETVIHGLKTCRDLCNTPSMRAIGCEEYKTVYPDCKNFVNDAEKYLDCMARSIAITIWHKSGTTKMGEASDPWTVVDPNLRVKGIAGLRVADASVFPFVVAGNTNLPTMLVAEKAADLIKEDIPCMDIPGVMNGVQQHQRSLPKKYQIFDMGHP